MRILGLIALAAGLMLGCAQAWADQLPATAIAFAADNYLTVDGVQFAVSDVDWDGVPGTVGTNCTGGVCSGASSCIDGTCLYMAPGSGPDPSIVIEAADASGTLVPIESYTCASSFCSDGSNDLSATVTATVVSGKGSLGGATAVVTGSEPGGSPVNWVGGNETLYGPAPDYDTPPACSEVDAYISTPGVCTFGEAFNSITATKDFRVGSGFLTGTYTLTSITEGFTFAPEPASIATLALALIALAIARSRIVRA